jgi:HK97 family phage prohead protease
MSSIEEVLRRCIAQPENGVPQVGVARRTVMLPTVRASSDTARTITFVSSTETVDRYGDIIRVAGWDTKNYMKNPVVLWSHKSTDPPIGRTISLKTESNPPALVQTVEFATKETYPFADQIFQLYKNGFLRSVSVGFRPTASPNMIRDDDGDLTGFEFTSQELLELSCVPLPANPDAVARAVGAGYITQADVDKVFVIPDESIERAEVSLELHRVIRSLEFSRLQLSLMSLKAKCLLVWLNGSDGAPPVSSASADADEISTLEQLEDALKGRAN